MFHDHCPNCHHHTLRAEYVQPPDCLTEEEYEAWLEDRQDDEPAGVICDHCGYQGA